MKIDDKISQYLIQNMRLMENSLVLRSFWEKVNSEFFDQVFGTNRYCGYAVMDMNKRTRKYAEFCSKLESMLEWDMPRVQVVGHEHYSCNAPQFFYNYLVNMFCVAIPMMHINSNEKNDFSNFFIKQQLCESYASILLWASIVGPKRISEERDWLGRMRLFSEFNNHKYFRESENFYYYKEIKVILMELLNSKKKEYQGENLAKLKRMMERTNPPGRR